MSKVQDWLDTFDSCSSRRDGSGIADLFVPDGFWRDYLPFGFTLQTLEDRDENADFADS